MMDTDKNTENPLKGTEQWAVQKELEEEKWQKEYRVKLPYYIDQMNALLAQDSDEAAEELKRMFLSDHIFWEYRQTDEFASMYVIMAIYETEKGSGITNTILKQGRTVAELLGYFFQLKMILYRFDFGIGNGAEQELLSFMRQYGTSTVTVDIMLNTSVMRPLKTALRLEKAFEEACMKEYEMSMLLYIERNWKGNYRIYEKLHQYGKLSAVPGLEKIQEAERDTALELLELMWKLCYKQSESEREIAWYLKKHEVTDQLWLCLLETGEVKEVEYYLLLVNALLEEGIFDKSEIVLEFLIRKYPEYETAVSILNKIREKRGRTGK